MANTFQTASALSRIATMVLENELVFPKLIHTGYTSDFVDKVGATVRIPTYATLTARDFTTDGSVTYSDLTETTTTITLDKFKYVAVKPTAKQMTLSIGDFTEQVIKPAMRALAQQVDEDCATTFYKGTGSHVGTAGTVPNTASAITHAIRTLDNMKAPTGADRMLVMNANMKASMLGIDTFVEADKRGTKTALERGEVGYVYGFNTYMDQNIQYHTPGTLNASVTFVTQASAAADATSITVTGHGSTVLAASGTILEGDCFSIGGYGYVATASATCGTGASTTVSISPPLVASVAGGATITFCGGGTGAGGVANTAYSNNLAFHKAAYSLAWARLAPPIAGADAATGANYQDTRMGGVSVTCYRDWSNYDLANTLTFAVLYGLKVVNPKLGVRIVGESNVGDV